MLDLVGVWRLVAGYAIANETGERTVLFGVAPRGYAAFEPNGRMMVIIVANNRVSGQSDAEMAQLYRSMVAYSGKWSVDDDKLMTEVDVASDPDWVGKTQVRYYRFDGKTLSLRSAPVEHPSFPGRKAVVYADWERG